MREKTNKNKGFIQIPLLVGIIAFVIVATGAGYGGFEYYKTSKIIGEAEQLTKEEKYNEAIEKLEIVQSKWVVKKLGLKRQQINDKIEANKINFEDQSKFNQSLGKLDEGNWQEAIDSFSELPENSFYYRDAQLKIEEAKRKSVEEELGETIIAKKEAEEKAEEEAAKRAEEEAKRAKEELERKIAEQKLSAKEAEEQRLNADSDGDGLTLREEQGLGTSDLNKDSDYDGIKDGEDLHPAGGGRNIPQNFSWSYGGQNWTWTYSIHEDWYEYYKKKPRTPHGLEYVTENDPFIKEIAKALKEGAEKEGYAVSLFITSFVQSLPYVQDAYTTFDEYPKYPIETFIERNGDCEDTSYLAASLVDASGYGSALVELPGHMAVAIKAASSYNGYYYELDDGRYYFFETTGESSGLGDMPPEYINAQAKITKAWDGRTINSYVKYKKPCDRSPDFAGYYYDGTNYYSDSQCNRLAYCLPYKEYYVNPQITTKLYWDSSCSQEVTIGCYKSDTYSGYFYDDAVEYYSDSRCIQKARICRPSPIYSGEYWDGSYSYWDSGCTQKVVSWCSKSIYYPGYFFNSIDYEIYVDYQCTQKASLY